MNLHLVFLIGLLGCASSKEETEQSFPLTGNCTNGKCGIRGTCTLGSRKCICGSDYTATSNECVLRTILGNEFRLLKDAAYNKTSGKCLPREINFRDACGSFSAECDGTIKDKKCKCLPGTFFLHEQCVPSAFPTETCSVAGETCSSNNGICSFTKSCLCKPGYYVEYERCVSKTFRTKDVCPSSTTCGEHGYCVDNVTCLCFPDYFVDGASCRRISFKSGRSCSMADAKVCAFGNGHCAQAPDKGAARCICNQGYFQEGDKCVTPYFISPLACRAVGDKCDLWKGVCSDHEVCMCKAGYFVQQGRCVRGSFFSADCSSSTKLCDDERGKCIEPGRCQCGNDSWVDNDTCVFPSFTQTGCEHGEDCSFGNGVCKGNATCMCKDGYVVYPVHAPNECRPSSTYTGMRATSSSSSLASPFCLSTIVTIAGASTLFWY